MSDAIRVYVLDDNPYLVSVLLRLLGRARGIDVIGGGDSRTESIDVAAHLDPQVMVLGLDMRGARALELIPRVRAAMDGVSVIALIWLDSEAYHDAALAAGADEVVGTETLMVDLAPAIERAAHKQMEGS